ncbi:HRDC domain-containing protein [Geobacter hydrogenophilus]|uniref:Ribonuclease D n=1 Tax=Geobacter hydrogenophilus TaxID=40983 RepID=A0A9W6FZX7_9BACT|nr:ribonuclease D [Geobacter hydrogenophilus]MBT0893422.1 HRDC domain-containing protein [Geobacter hydrogenophilus]GLI37884.1 ribonuclease D [Geobacter hydrogenophilus]
MPVQPVSPEIITTPDGVCRLADRLSREPYVACDLEADSMHHYQEKVCLIQFAVPGLATIVDPLAVADLAPLAPVFANPSIRKVFHGADYDIRSLHRDFGIEVNNLFDTMIACQFLGEREFGLAAVLRKRFGVELDKQYQRADWSRRPLTAGMIEYAVKDTTLLIELCGRLEAELREKGRSGWVEEECALLARVRVAQRSDDEPMFLRFKGASRMASRSLAVLEEILRFRDRRAQQMDVPPFKVLGTETVRELAEKKPRSLAELTGITGITERVVERCGEGVVRAVEKGLAVPEQELPSFPREERRKVGGDEERRIKALKGWREDKARRFAVEPGFLANNALLEQIALTFPRSEKELEGIAGLRPWQRREFGAEMVATLQARR